MIECALEGRTPLVLALEMVEHSQQQRYGWLPRCLEFVRRKIFWMHLDGQLDLKLICLHPSLNRLDDFFWNLNEKNNPPNISSNMHLLWQKMATICWFSSGRCFQLCLTQACSQHLSDSDFGSRGCMARWGMILTFGGFNKDVVSPCFTRIYWIHSCWHWCLNWEISGE